MSKELSFRLDAIQKELANMHRGLRTITDATAAIIETMQTVVDAELAPQAAADAAHPDAPAAE